MIIQPYAVKMRHLLLISIILFSLSCKTVRQPTKLLDDGVIDFYFLQLNDVYEIAPLENGKIGGMARVATLNNQLKGINGNTLTVLAGDFLSPSLLGTLKWEGKRIKGRQMVETMNAAGVDLVTFGNHEFDLELDELQARINESAFEWISSNVLLRQDSLTSSRFYKNKAEGKEYFQDHWIWNISDADGTEARIGIFGVTLPTFQKPYTHIEDFYLEARKANQHLSRQCDVMIGITHLERVEDSLLALQLFDVPLLLGGHDHEHMLFKVGGTTIAKADANAKTAYLHHLKWNKYFGTVAIRSKLIPLDSTIALDPKTDAIVEKWNHILLERIKEIIDRPSEVILHPKVPLDGRESSIRNSQTNLGHFVTEAMAMACEPPVNGAILNSGSIRIDDQLAGDLTPVDFFRAMPYGGEILVAEMKGAFLEKVLNAGEAGKGKGAYLQRYGFSPDGQSSHWLENGRSINEEKIYRLALNDFLLQGLDIEFLKTDAPEIIKIHRPLKGSLAEDIRRAVVAWSKKQSR